MVLDIVTTIWRKYKYIHRYNIAIHALCVQQGCDCIIFFKTYDEYNLIFIPLIVCAAKESVWICVTCGQLNCGRYVKAHALSHYDKAPDGNGHPVCLECNELSVFW